MEKELGNNESNDEIEYKLILLGDTSVGKTCLFKKLTTGKFLEKNVSTVGIDRRTIKVKSDFEENGKTESKTVIINLTDTAGQERFKAITKTYYKGSDGAVLLYDITDKKTFEHLKDWIESIKTTALYNNKYSIFLIGTKVDLVENGIKKREVELEEAKKKCEEYGLEWGGECSNKDFSVDQYIEIFKGFTQTLYKKIGEKKFVQQSMIKLDTNLKRNRAQSNNCEFCR